MEGSLRSCCITLQEGRLGAPERGLRQTVRAERESRLTGETGRHIQSAIGIAG